VRKLTILETPKTSETQEITADDFVLIQFSTKPTKVLYTGQVESHIRWRLCRDMVLHSCASMR